jgi:hypothetical protein
MKGLIVVSILLFHIALALSGIGLSIYGLVLAFKASLVLGVIVLVVEPSPLILGLVGVFRPDVAQQLAHWLGL